MIPAGVFNQGGASRDLSKEVWIAFGSGQPQNVPGIYVNTITPDYNIAEQSWNSFTAADGSTSVSSFFVGTSNFGASLALKNIASPSSPSIINKYGSPVVYNPSLPEIAALLVAASSSSVIDEVYANVEGTVYLNDVPKSNTLPITNTSSLSSFVSEPPVSQMGNYRVTIGGSNQTTKSWVYTIVVTLK